MTLCGYCGFEEGGALCGKSNPEACAEAKRFRLSCSCGDSECETEHPEKRQRCEACGKAATRAPDPGNGGSDAFLCDACYEGGGR